MASDGRGSIGSLVGRLLDIALTYAISPYQKGFSDLMTVLFPSDHMTLLAFIFTLPLFPHSDSASCTHARKLHRCDAYVINSTNTHANCHGDSWRRPGPPVREYRQFLVNSLRLPSTTTIQDCCKVSRSIVPKTLSLSVSLSLSSIADSLSLFQHGWSCLHTHSPPSTPPPSPTKGGPEGPNE
jgi:hypothetical protein